LGIMGPVTSQQKRLRNLGVVMEIIKKYWALWLVLGINTSLLIVAWIILR